MEAEAAYWIKDHGTKPVVAFIAGSTAPKGRTTAMQALLLAVRTILLVKAILSQCGIHVIDSPAEIGSKMLELLA